MTNRWNNFRAFATLLPLVSIMFMSAGETFFAVIFLCVGWLFLLDLKGIFLKLSLTVKVLFCKHFVVIKIKDSEISKMLSDEKFHTTLEWCGLREYEMYKLLKSVASLKNEVSMILSKAKFEAEAELKAREN